MPAKSIQLLTRDLRRLHVAEDHRMIDGGVFDEDERVELLEGVIVSVSRIAVGFSPLFIGAPTAAWYTAGHASRCWRSFSPLFIGAPTAAEADAATKLLSGLRFSPLFIGAPTAAPLLSPPIGKDSTFQSPLHRGTNCGTPC